MTVLAAQMQRGQMAVLRRPHIVVRAVCTTLGIVLKFCGSEHFLTPPFASYFVVMHVIMHAQLSSINRHMIYVALFEGQLKRAADARSETKMVPLSPGD